MKQQLEARTRELADAREHLAEALEQQTATANVLRVISTSPGDLEPVFQAMLANAVRLCDAKFGTLNLYDGEAFRAGALHDVPPAYADIRRGMVIRPDPRTSLGRIVRTREVVHIDDLRTTEPYLEGNPAVQSLSDLGGARTLVTVPMVLENELVGVIGIYRQEVRPFTNNQIELVENFAAQAVIAIENTRLLNELRQRTDDLSEALEQQTATSEVLKVISSSPGELELVFNAILQNAVHICEANFGNLLLYEGGFFRHVALHNAPPAWAAERERDPVPPRDKARILYRVAATKEIAHIADMAAENPDEPIAAIAGARTVLIVPMLKERELVGAIAIYRQDVRLFSNKQIELLQNFAAQAIIAIENTRLLNELRESLAQQTATADVLKVVSSSPGELEPVFQAMLENAVRICGANFGTLQLREKDAFRIAAMHNPPPAFAEARRRNPLIYPSTHNAVGRVMATKRFVHIADYTQEPAYKQGDPAAVGFVELAGARTLVVVPMLKEDELVGNLLLYRQEVRPFTDKQISLLQNFARQAVIAIENARLLKELRESLAQQTATSEVLSVISNSPGELQPVFQAMLENSVRICEAKFGQMFLCEGDAVRRVAHFGLPTALVEFDETRGAFHPRAGGGLDRVVRTKQVVHIADYSSEQLLNPVARLGGARSYIGVPMLKESALIGTINIYRQEVQPFTDKQIELVSNFAKQAVIAIENTRLLNELRESLLQQTATSDVLKVISRSTFDLKAVLDTLVEFGGPTVRCGFRGHSASKRLGLPA